MRLIDYVEDLQKQGQLWFTKSSALAVLGISQKALQKAIEKLVAKRRIKIIKSQFVVIVPIEYQDWGIVPATWFIDPLMRHLNDFVA